MEEIRISVIIPVYNVEKYLDTCVNSVMNQQYRNLEIILIDDGSTDKSGKICDQYGEMDHRIQVIHKPNGGLSSARNLGIRNATGEYILFLDSDDLWCEKDTVRRLVDRVRMTHADVTSFSFSKFRGEDHTINSYFGNLPSMQLGLDKDEQLRYLSENGLYIASAWNKLIKRSILNEHMMFSEGVYAEDVDWCAKLLQNSESFDYVKDVLLLYRQHNASIRHNITKKKCQDLTHGIINCCDLIEETQGSTRKALQYYSAFQLATFFMVQAQSDTIPYDCISQLKEHSGILRFFGRNVKVMCLYCMSRILGFSLTCSIIRSIMGKRR